MLTNTRANLCSYHEHASAISGESCDIIIIIIIISYLYVPVELSREFLIQSLANTERLTASEASSEGRGGVVFGNRLVTRGLGFGLGL